MNDPNEGKEDYINVDSVKKNVAAINAAMSKAGFKRNELKNLLITDDDVNKMTELVPLLDALEEGVTLIGAENYSTGSTVLPFLVKFNKLLKKDETDPGYMMDFKKLLRNDLEERCNKNLNKLLLSKASFLDKRFSSLKFLQHEALIDKEDVIAEIREELKEVEHNTVHQESVASKEKEPPKKKRFLGKGLGDDSDDEENSAANGNKSAQTEV